MADLRNKLKIAPLRGAIFNYQKSKETGYLRVSCFYEP